MKRTASFRSGILHPIDPRLIPLLYRTILFIAIACTAVQPQERAFRFESLTTASGLSSNHITALFQDHLGYLWIGTIDGLNRYDGEEVLTWYHHPLDSTSIYSNSITCIFEDRIGGLWIGTQHAINRMDRSTGRCERFYIPGVQAICQDSAGVLWAGAYTQGLYYYEAGKKLWTKYQPSKLRGSAPEDDFIYRLVASGSRLWLATTNHGPKVLDLTEGSYAAPPGWPAEQGVQDVAVDPSGNIWLATTAAGLHRLDPQGTRHAVWRQGGPEANGPASDRLSALVLDQEGSLWLGHEKDGLDRFDPRTGRFQHFRHDPDDPFSLRDETILVLYCDESGILWAGTKYGGVQKIDYRQIRFFPGRIAGMGEDEKIWCFSPGAGGAFWIGADSGARLVDRRSFKVLSRVRTPFPVRAIVEDPRHGVWLATLGDGLWLWEPTTGRVTIHRHIPHSVSVLSCNYLYALVQDSTGVIWIASHGGGLDAFDPARGLFRHYPFSLFSQDPKADNWGLCLLEDGQAGLWIGAWEFGVLHFDKRRGAYTVLADRWPILRNSTILSLGLTPNGILWAGAHGNGLYRIDPQRDSCKLYTDAEGLPNNVIYGIAADSAGALWLTTNKGLCSLDPERKIVRSYSPADGLLSQEFNLGALHRSRDGVIYAAGAEGFNYFSPVVAGNRRPPRVVLTRVLVNGRAADPAIGAAGERLQLQYAQNQLSFRFRALPFSRNAAYKFGYRLDGLEEKWQNAEQSRQVDYAGIPPGHYRFAVKAADEEGRWSEETQGVEIWIQPPFWRRWYFLCGLAVLLGLAAWRLYRVRVNRLLALERIRISERERVRERVAADFHDQLGHRLTKISMLSKRLIKSGAGDGHDSDAALKKIAENADMSIKEMRQLVWELDPRKDTLLDLMTHLKNCSDDLFDETEIAFALEGMSPDWARIRLSMELRRQAAAIFQEGMHNILKHARGCRHVSLTASLPDGILHLTLADDGGGFEAHALANGRGLPGMQSRAQKAGGMLQVASDPSGTRLHFQVKLDSGLVDS